MGFPNLLKSDSGPAEVKAMPHPLSIGLRERVVAFAVPGHSCNEAAFRFETSVSFAVNLMALYRETGSVVPRAIGGKTIVGIAMDIDATLVEILRAR